MTQDNLSQVMLLALAFQQQAQDTGQDAHQLLAEWINGRTAEEGLALLYHWPFWARPDQLPPPGDRWWVWLIMGGRGSGKTRPGAEWIIQKEREWYQKKRTASDHLRLALVAETEDDGRDIMVEGESGLLACAPPHNRPAYYPERRKLIWKSGAEAKLYSGDSPGQLRGPQHHFAWLDEFAKWKYPEEAYANLEFGLRLGDHPQCVITTTPRPLAILKELMADPGCVTVQAKTYDNAAHLPEKFIQRMEQRYKGTRRDRQEIDGELLEDTPGALWTLEMIDKTRIRTPANPPDCRRIVIGVDPQGKEAADMLWVSDEDEGSETGIVVCGEGYDGRYYVLEDLSGNFNPHQWAQESIAAYKRHSASLIVAESNHGGEMVRDTIQVIDLTVPVDLVRASEGKTARAEPISAFYRQGQVCHVGHFAFLEDEMRHYTGREKQSPNRLDALVWALHELLISGRQNDPMSHYDPAIHESRPQTRRRGEHGPFIIPE